MGWFSKPLLPKDDLVVAVGDIHGCLELLQKLQREIIRHAESIPAKHRTIVYLGDYIDRGPDSKGVIDQLLTGLPGFESVFIKGNHEQFLLDFLKDPGSGQTWLDGVNGGRATLESYGVAEPHYFTDLPAVQKQFAEAFDVDHRAFFAMLQPSYQRGQYFFTHAGVHPNYPLSAQRPEDLLWIREPFLSSTKNYGKIVVHGHTITTHPDIKPNRIGIDTGAFWSGMLTAMIAHGDRREFLSVRR